MDTHKISRTSMGVQLTTRSIKMLGPPPWVPNTKSWASVAAAPQVEAADPSADAVGASSGTVQGLTP